jgi:hypothetical protein
MPQNNSAVLMALIRQSYQGESPVVIVGPLAFLRGQRRNKNHSQFCVAHWGRCQSEFSD